MDFYIFKPVLNSINPTAIGILQNVESVVWSNYIDEIGDVEINVALTDYNMELLQAGNLVRKPLPTVLRVGESWSTKQDVTVYEMAVIKEVDINASNQTLKASCKLLDDILNTRFNAAYTVLDGSRNFFTWFSSFISTFTNQSNYRALPMAYNAGNLASSGTATISDCSVAYNTIAEVIETVRSQNEGTGEHSAFNVRLFNNIGDWAGTSINPGNYLIPFWSFNRTGINEPIIFRYDKDDLDNIIINDSNEDYSNVAFIAGEGEGTERVTTWYPATNSGIKGTDRHELFVDARDLKREDYSSSSKYISALRNRGKEKLVAEVATVEFDLVRSDYVYGTDYYLGDLVGVVIEQIDTMLKLPVSGAIESFDADGYKISLEYGQPKESFAKRIKKRLK